IHVVPKSPRIKSGANDLAGFIEAPVIGAAQSPARAIYPPTAIAPLVPMLRAPEAVPRPTQLSGALPSPKLSVAYATAWHCRPKNRPRFCLQNAFHDQLASPIHDGNRDRCLVNLHADILFLVNNGAPFGKCGANNHNLPYSGRLFILREHGE